MREILFRGQIKDTKEWVEGAYYHQTDFYGDICNYHYIITSKGELEDNMMIFDEVIPETIGQFTGLYDSTKWEELTKEEQSDWLKNYTAAEWKGRKIFEGDIVTSKYYLQKTKVENSVIKFGEWNCNCCHGVFGWVSNGFIDFRDEDVIVIGNIHDNPELLEAGEDAE